MRRLWMAAGLLAAALSEGAVAAEETAAPAKCRLQVVHALPTDGGVDEKIKPLEERLRRPPFREWKTFRLLTEEERELRPTSSTEYQLPEGRKAELLFAERATVPTGKPQIRGSLKIEGPRSAARTMFSLDEGGVLLVAGHRHQGGILIYSLSCRVQ